MSHSKNYPSLLHGRFHLETVVQTGRHRLFTQDMISLLSECKTNLEVHLVLHGNDNSIAESLSHRLDSICRCLMQLLPCIEDESLIDTMSSSKVAACLGTWLGNGDNLALRGLFK